MAKTPKYPQAEIDIDLNGESGGPINILASTILALRDAGAPDQEVDQFVHDFFYAQSYEENLQRVSNLVTTHITGNK